MLSLSALSSIIKNFELKNVLIGLNLYVVFGTLSISLDIFLRRNSGLVTYRFKAYFDVLLNMRSLLKKRSYVQTTVRKIPDSEICQLIVWPNPVFFKDIFGKNKKISGL